MPFIFIAFFSLLIYVFNVRKCFQTLTWKWVSLEYHTSAWVVSIRCLVNMASLVLEAPIKLDECVFTFNISYNHTFPSFWLFLKFANLLMVLLWHLYMYFVLHFFPTAFSHSKTCHVYASESDIFSSAHDF